MESVQGVIGSQRYCVSSASAGRPRTVTIGSMPYQHQGTHSLESTQLQSPSDGFLLANVTAHKMSASSTPSSVRLPSLSLSPIRHPLANEQHPSTLPSNVRSVDADRDWPEWLQDRQDFKTAFASRLPDGDSRGLAMSANERRSLMEAELARACSKEKLARSPADVLAISRHLAEQSFCLGYDSVTIDRLARSLTYEYKAPGDAIVVQGDVGDAFYMLIGGSADVYVRGLGQVGSIQCGGTFGEIALTSSDTRQATVKAGPLGARMLCLTRVEYQDVLAGGHLKWLEGLTDFLAAQALFASWSRNRLRRLAMIIGTRNASAGEVVVNQGAEADRLYFLRLGTCELVHEESLPGENRFPVSRTGVMEAAEAHARLVERTEAEERDKVAREKMCGTWPGEHAASAVSHGRLLSRASASRPGTSAASLRPTEYEFPVTPRGVQAEHGYGLRRTVLRCKASIGELHPGAMYGLSSVAQGLPHPFTVLALVPCQLLYVHAKYLKPNALEGSPGHALAVGGAVSTPRVHRPAAQLPVPAQREFGKMRKVRVNLLDGIGPNDLGCSSTVSALANGAGEPTPAVVRARAIAAGTLPADPNDGAMHGILQSLKGFGITIREGAAYYLRVHGQRIQGQQTQALLRRRRNSLSLLVDLAPQDCEVILRRMMTRLDDESRAQREMMRGGGGRVGVFTL